MTFYDQWRYVLFAQHESFEKELNDCQQFSQNHSGMMKVV